MKGAPDWFVPGESGHLVCWWVPQGYLPNVAEGLEKWHILKDEGEREHVIGAKGKKALSARTAA